MRKGRQYDFEKLENPDMNSSKDNTKDGDDTVALMLAAARKKTLLQVSEEETAQAMKERGLNPDAQIFIPTK